MIEEKFCAIILNRNLPKVTDKLYEKLKRKNNDLDIFVVEAGSDKKRLSKYCTWHANWKAVRDNGLRYSRGMNFALSNLEKENKLENYKAFILLTNDTEFKDYKITAKINKILLKHDRIGILSPCSKDWGEYKLLKRKNIKYFWFIHNNAYIITKNFINKVKNKTSPGYLNFFLMEQILEDMEQKAT